jgi:hypothetical protein
MLVAFVPGAVLSKAEIQAAAIHSTNRGTLIVVLIVLKAAAALRGCCCNQQRICWPSFAVMAGP